ncbi:hypothetical protein ASC77_09850 [Nocardioides sp. Root1257]|uniref:hypothetical protein n=1 Tax=unclassified Nocardioides TaxID=2615069 RepID=UPI0006FD1C15|nr:MULTISPECIES: hypothetical protein [unclassified Nocardioides]KQW49003.1 hypothetical protein ASC77_09850 [Nocardioides sp. Root1257]KRC48177.1 hypothetical protein ASE24_09855 [Nocardioides sp. Root224]
MRTITIGTTAVLGAVATMLTATLAATLTATATAASPASAAGTAVPVYDARAALSRHDTCVKDASTGITRRALVLDNRRSSRRVQFKVVRAGDRVAGPVVYQWVGAHRKRTVVVSVAQRTTASVRVRVPEMGRKRLVLSALVPARPSCYVATVHPVAALGGVSCQGPDSVAQVVLDNRGTTDSTIGYTIASSYGDSSASVAVRPASTVNYYLPVPAGGSTHVEVSARGSRVLSTDVAAVSCP